MQAIAPLVLAFIVEHASDRAVLTVDALALIAFTCPEALRLPGGVCKTAS